LIGARGDRARAQLLYVGSRRSPTATKAAERLPILPATHSAAALGIAHVLVREGRYDRRFVEEHTFGFHDWTDDEGNQRMGFRRLLLERYYPDRAAALCGCEPGQIVRVARRLARADSPLVVSGGESGWSVDGTRTAIAAQALNALLGSFDRQGGVVLPPPIPLTSLDAANSRLGALPEGIFSQRATAGALGSDTVEALIDSADGIEVLILVEANPVYNSPAGERLQDALRQIPLVVAIAPFHDETAAEADVVLPASLFLESWRESTTPPGVAFSFIGVSHPVVDPLFDSRHPGDVLLEVARRVGDPTAAAFPWESYEAYLRERLNGLLTSGQGAVISGSFEESWVHFLEERGWRFLEHDDREAFWEDLTREGGWWNPVRNRGDWQRLLATKTGRYEFFSLELERQLQEFGRATGPPPASAHEALQRGVEALGLTVEADEACLPHFDAPAQPFGEQLALVPFRPITSRGNLGVASPMLLEMYGHAVLSGWQTWVELAPETAHELHLDEGDVVALASDRGEIEAVVKIEPGTTPGVAHLPLGLGRSAGVATRGEIGANPLRIAPELQDRLSGELAAAPTPVRLRRVRPRRRGGPRPLDGGHG
jgi:anaerobic selenocysteine-containing dehydrogenase